MKYDHKLVRESNKKRAEAELKEAIKKALKADLYYEDICEIVAKTINEVAEEKGNGKVCDNLLNEKIFNKCFVYPKHVAIEIDDKVLDFLIGMSNLSNEEILVKLFEKRGCGKVNVEYLMEEVLWTDPTRDTMYTYKISKEVA